VTTFTLLDEARPVTLDATVTGDDVRLAPADVATALGWELKAQGLCRGARCVPVPPGTLLVRQDGVDLTTLASLLGRPLALDAAEHAACLGAAADERAERLTSLDAPDFRLPDVDGRMHALSDHRGRKVFLLAWASW
jgi:hypothetical protein